MAEPLLELINVSKFYTGTQQIAVGLNAVNLRLRQGEFVAVTGESGSGKSTLAHVLGGILPYESGELLFRGEPTSHYGGLDWEAWRRDNVSFISQSYGLLPGATVMRNMMSALILSGMDQKQAKRSAGDILRKVDLWEFRNRRASRLSSGQKQRLSIARALAKSAPILIADEPTGNLDTENSCRIMELLADAAKERLVILVTHDFDAAKDLVSRRVVLKNGCILSDAVLRPAAEPEPTPASETKVEKKRSRSFYVAWLQCLCRPVWTAIMVLFFSITAFAVFVFLGVLVSSLDDTSTRIFDHSIFHNGDPTRILAMKKDMENLSEEDFTAFLSLPYVEEVERWGGMSDMQYGYRYGVDYDVLYEFDKYTHSTSYHLTENAPFCKTIPMLHEGEPFLTEGRLPEHLFEVVSADPDHAIGDIVKVLVGDTNLFAKGIFDHQDLQVQVVGRTNRGEGLYFHTDLARMFRQAYLINGQTATDHGFFYIPSNPLGIPPILTSYGMYGRNISLVVYRNEAPSAEKGTFRGNSQIFSDLLRFDPDADQPFPSVTFRSDEMENGEYRTVELLPQIDKGDLVTLLEQKYENRLMANFYDDGAFTRTVLVDYDAFDILCWRHTNEASITIQDYAYTDEVLAALDNLGYTGISVYRQCSVEKDPILEAQRVQSIRFSILVLLALAVLQVLFLRIMFSAETENYRLLSNIGLTGQTARQSVVIQTAFFTVLGELIAAGIIYLCVREGVHRVTDIQKFLTPPAVLLLVAVHIILSALATIWIVRALRKRVYPLDTEKMDLDLGRDDIRA